MIRLVRKYPDGIEFKQVLAGDGFVNGNATHTIGEVIVSGPQGVVANPDKYWTCDWLIKDSAAGTTYSKVSTGFGPVRLPMKTDEIDICSEIYEKGAFVIMVDDAGKAITSETGEVIIVQKERRE